MGEAKSVMKILEDEMKKMDNSDLVIVNFKNLEFLEYGKFAVHLRSKYSTFDLKNMYKIIKLDLEDYQDAVENMKDFKKQFFSYFVPFILAAITALISFVTSLISLVGNEVISITDFIDGISEMASSFVGISILFLSILFFVSAIFHFCLRPFQQKKIKKYKLIISILESSIEISEENCSKNGKLVEGDSEDKISKNLV